MDKGVNSPLRAVLLTALKLEFAAVRSHLKNIREATHPQGTVYEIGTFSGEDGSVWEICLAETGAGNTNAAREAERALGYFRPHVAMFIGVAGGLKDVSIGDVVIATKIYGYESGKAESEFHGRPEVHESSYELQQRARAEARRQDWTKRIGGAADSFRAFVAPVASGEKVIASRLSHFCRFIRESYGDALAVETEGWGFLAATHANQDVRALVVRGYISSRLRKARD